MNEWNVMAMIDIAMTSRIGFECTGTWSYVTVVGIGLAQGSHWQNVVGVEADRFSESGMWSRRSGFI